MSLVGTIMYNATLNFCKYLSVVNYTLPYFQAQTYLAKIANLHVAKEVIANVEKCTEARVVETYQYRCVKNKNYNVVINLLDNWIYRAHFLGRDVQDLSPKESLYLFLQSRRLCVILIIRLSVGGLIYASDGKVVFNKELMRC